MNTISYDICFSVDLWPRALKNSIGYQDDLQAPVQHSAQVLQDSAHS